ncbi:hypothetical protein CPAR01_03240 [Colletotrichum paranaense]|uniref:Uncharacterized protein n=3 Tax=Colletotrichum acutatum species complex TaxID=2707335 RepID=A0AAI9YHN8_9PEZI|nr:uncharacterized protein CCOS01_15174 [Colletotrichum costaricense]XP_060354855.1 uncharacterized protein CPAR01_03240 [Colletotrichum paranaense]KAK1462140.1 hypothetical protein CMEL01_14107 [Colletotrichum melonis]KAK1510343.1 hypothetical protein CCOS01_15174 [Colletotrichum costaricense]KAK1545738.1 hypothetical protein CPAR01_03240 [Colletotrichum paranaense]
MIRSQEQLCRMLHRLNSRKHNKDDYELLVVSASWSGFLILRTQHLQMPMENSS